MALKTKLFKVIEVKHVVGYMMGYVSVNTHILPSYGATLKTNDVFAFSPSGKYLLVWEGGNLNAPYKRYTLISSMVPYFKKSTAFVECGVVDVPSEFVSELIGDGGLFWYETAEPQIKCIEKPLEFNVSTDVTVCGEHITKINQTILNEDNASNIVSVNMNTNFNMDNGAVIVTGNDLNFDNDKKDNACIVDKQLNNDNNKDKNDDNKNDKNDKNNDKNVKKVRGRPKTRGRKG